MLFTLVTLLVVFASIALFHWIATVPLLRTISISIETWADEVQGIEASPAAD